MYSMKFFNFSCRAFHRHRERDWPVKSATDSFCDRTLDVRGGCQSEVTAAENEGQLDLDSRGP